MAIFNKQQSQAKSQVTELIIPRHVGIIMDGNGRWAKKRGLPRQAGHKFGADTFRKTVRYCNKLGVEFLTVYAFSTENWKRPKDEVNGIINILREYLIDAKNYKAENVKTRFIGDLSVFDDDIREKMAECEKVSADFTGLTLNVAVNYGSKSELLAATKEIAKKAKLGELSPEDITEETIESFLTTAGEPAVDLIIRPSGEQRLSNFLLWQAAYAELVFMDVLWPDFDEKSMDKALLEYSKRSRRFGGI